MRKDAHPTEDFDQMQRLCRINNERLACLQEVVREHHPYLAKDIFAEGEKRFQSKNI